MIFLDLGCALMLTVFAMTCCFKKSKEESGESHSQRIFDTAEKKKKKPGQKKKKHSHHKSTASEKFGPADYTDNKTDAEPGTPKKRISKKSFEAGEEKREQVMVQATKQAQEIHRMRDQQRKPSQKQD